jgi:hypothetical protein
MASIFITISSVKTARKNCKQRHTRPRRGEKVLAKMGAWRKPGTCSQCASRGAGTARPAHVSQYGACARLQASDAARGDAWKAHRVAQRSAGATYIVRAANEALQGRGVVVKRPVQRQQHTVAEDDGQHCVIKPALQHNAPKQSLPEPGPLVVHDREAAVRRRQHVVDLHVRRLKKLGGCARAAGPARCVVGLQPDTQYSPSLHTPTDHTTTSSGAGTHGVGRCRNGNGPKSRTPHGCTACERMPH